MLKYISTFLLLLFIAEATEHNDNKSFVYVEYPEKVKEQMLANMRDHLVAINEILECLAFDDLELASEIAKSRLGLEARKAHGSHELVKYMPKGMQQLGYLMHHAAGEFAKVTARAAKDNDRQAAYEALTEVTRACVACHTTYRAK